MMMEQLRNFDANHVFFTSDTHFGHLNIIKYCNRPFKNVEEMDEELVARWNKVVSDNDIVFHLGDFCFGELPYWESIRKRLNGSIYLILGNHDYRIFYQDVEKMNQLFERIGPQMCIKVSGQDIILNHYPFLCYSGSGKIKPVWNLFGHIHSGPLSSPTDDLCRTKFLLKAQYDVGVDNNNYAPISFNQIKSIIYGT